MMKGPTVAAVEILPETFSARIVLGEFMKLAYGIVRQIFEVLWGDWENSGFYEPSRMLKHISAKKPGPAELTQMIWLLTLSALS